MGRKQPRQKFSSRKAKHRAALNTRRLNVEHLEDRRLLAAVTVTNNLDVVNGDTSSIPNLIAAPGTDGISLREAIEAANTDAAADTIDFAPSLSGDTLLLTQGEFVLTEELTIDASGLPGNLTIDAQQNSRIFNITASTGDFALAGLTLTGGYTGGTGGAVNISSSDLLTISQSKITDNYAVSPGGGIFSNGDVTLLDSAVSNNINNAGAVGGGGISSTGNISLFDSTVSNNRSEGGIGGGLSSFANVSLVNSKVENNNAASNGGGIATFGGVSLLNSSVSGNISGSNGGGVNASQDVILTNSSVNGNIATITGGGIVTLDSPITLDNSTVSSNKSYSQTFGVGGITSVFGDILLSNSTVAENSDQSDSEGDQIEDQLFGGIATKGNATISNSIVSGNTSEGRSLEFGPTTNLQVDYSLIGDTSNLTIAQIADLNAGTVNLLDIDPLLGPLTNNGGPTKTHALLAGSPAIDAGDPAIAAPPANDQRGTPFQRIADGNADTISRIDIGAYEVPDTLVVTTHIDEDDSSTNPAFGNGTSLREAIDFANSIPIPFNINFAPGLDAATIQIDQLNLGALPTITDNLSIDASNLSGGLTIHAGHGLDGVPKTGDGIRVLNIDDGDDMSEIQTQLTELILTGGDIPDWGGGIYSREDVSINSSTITGNATGPGFLHNGGGIIALLGKLNINQSILSNNHTLDNGGGIFARDANVTINDSAITNNYAGRSGGAIANDSSRSLISKSVISGNESLGSGGAISNREIGGSTTIISSTISGNSTQGSHGSAISEYSGTTLLRDSTVYNNSSNGGGSLHLSWDNYVSTIILENSILGGSKNHSGQAIPEFDQGFISLTVVISNGSIIENPGNAPITGSRNLFNVDPRLGPLADNGGPTKTHALLPGSPAIDAGFSTSSTDQRGLTAPVDLAEYQNTPGGNGRDIGAYEAQTPPSADFDNSGYVGGLDFLAWQRGFGSTDATKPTGNSDDDTDGDASDLAAWSATFGGGPPTAADFDTSGNVGGLDFLTWQRGFGSTTATKPEGDTNNDADVDSDDLDTWKSLFGHQAPLAYTTPPPAPLQAATTEPANQTIALEPTADFQIAQLAQIQERTNPQKYTSPKRQRVDKSAPQQIALTPYASLFQTQATKIKPPTITTKEHSQHKETTDEAFAQLAKELLSDNFPSLSGRG